MIYIVDLESVDVLVHLGNIFPINGYLWLWKKINPYPEFRKILLDKKRKHLCENFDESNMILQDLTKIL